jgi:hypothetical protein
MNHKKRAQSARKTSFDPARLKPENVSDEVWQDWVKFRRETRKPLTETTCTYQAKQLAGHQNADEVIRRSIAGGWQGLFLNACPINRQRQRSFRPAWVMAREILGTRSPTTVPQRCLSIRPLLTALSAELTAHENHPETHAGCRF